MLLGRAFDNAGTESIPSVEITGYNILRPLVGDQISEEFVLSDARPDCLLDFCEINVGAARAYPRSFRARRYQRKWWFAISIMTTRSSCWAAKAETLWFLTFGWIAWAVISSTLLTAKCLGSHCVLQAAREPRLVIIYMSRVKARKSLVQCLHNF